MTISTWAPRARIISNITQANPGVVTTTQPHGYLDGLYVRIDMAPKPSLFGMTQVAGKVYLISVIDSTSFSIDANTSTFDAFNYVTHPQAAQSIPVGEIASTLANREQNTLTPTSGI